MPGLRLRRREFMLGMGGLAAKRGDFRAAEKRLDRAIAAGDVSAAVLYVSRGRSTFVRAFGRAKTPEARFLLASITKPMTATAVMTLVDRGALSLSDRVVRFIPEFAGGDRALVTVRHLLTHTSGLPDQLPENLELRRRHAPLREFVSGACRTPLLFKPGSEVRYQSMGLLLAAEITERLTKMPLREYLRKQVFEPLGMSRASLGLGGRRIDETMLCQAPEELWDGWNSPYWRNLCAPWGGAHASAADIARLLGFFARPTGRVLRAETARAMVTNQTPGMAESWGLGWRLANGGRGCSARTFGHDGATGTISWLDPERDLCFVLLTTWPLDQSKTRLLEPVSDDVSRAG